MSRKNLSIMIVITLFLFHDPFHWGAAVNTDAKEHTTSVSIPGTTGEMRKDKGEPLPDGLKIMNMVFDRPREKDYSITMAWVFTDNGRARFRAKYEERRKNYAGKDGLFYKSFIKYISPPNIRRRSFLTWYYKDGKRLFWYYVLKMPRAELVPDITFLRSPAESDFQLIDYVEITPSEEKHKVLGIEKDGDATYYLVESTPIKNSRPYGKRISRIDIDKLTPVRVNYFDKKGNPWKILDITWQKIEGIWFWKKAVAKNLQKNYQTYIIVEDAKINIGLNNREFTAGFLERQNF